MSGTDRPTPRPMTSEFYSAGNGRREREREKESSGVAIFPLHEIIPAEEAAATTVCSSKTGRTDSGRKRKEEEGMTPPLPLQA